MEGSIDSNKFAEELHWCISQLELGLQRQSPDSRQVSESIKLLKILKSQKAPLVKKRQVMRNAFGDYRKKMKEAERKSLSGLRHSRFQPLDVKSSTASQFLKMSYNKQLNVGQVQTDLDKNLSSLRLETSAYDPSASASLKSESQAGELVHQANHGFMNSSEDCLNKSNHAENLKSSSQSSSLICSQGSPKKFDAISSPQSSKSYSHLSSSSVNAVKDSGKLNQLTSGQTSTSSSLHGGSSSSHFRYEPSDNSFTFGFENTENINNEDKQETTADEDEISDPDKIRQVELSNNKIADNSFKYDQSDNDFCFNFEKPTDEL